MSDTSDYFSALQRLISNRPVRVSTGSKINKDTVALEAGRKRGSIKKSRPGFTNLIIEINKASAPSTKPKNDLSNRLKKIREDKNKYRERYHQSLNREIMLLNRLSELEKELNKLSNVIPFKE